MRIQNSKDVMRKEKKKREKKIIDKKKFERKRAKKGEKKRRLTVISRKIQSMRSGGWID